MSSAYYRPYTSDSDSDTESTSGSSLRSDTSSSSYASSVSAAPGPNFRQLAQGLTLGGLAGPSFDTSGQDLDNANLPGGFPISSGYPTFGNYDLPKDPSGSTLKSSSQNVTSIVMLDSRDRDRNVYIQPTNLTLRLPRVYSNVTSFQIVQMKLLSAFFYFRRDKNNTDISILELGRTRPENSNLPNVVKTFIRPGTYDINSLLLELTTQLNRTPIFYDYPNGFQDFAPRFAATGDFSLNFNFPGDTYYDSLLNQFIPNPTMNLIISKYFQSQYAGLSSYSTNQIKVAYYYAVVKEILLDENFPTPMNLNIVTSTAALLPGETVRSRCIYTFQGLNDAVVLEVINLNLNLLDSYRIQHTFRYTLVNKYNVTFETQSNRVTFSSPSLNTSLTNLLNYKQAQFLAEALAQAGITQAQYNTFVTQNTTLLAVLNDLFYYIQRWLATYFAVQFNTYALSYIATPSNVIPIRDGFGATGISSNYDAASLSRDVPPQSNDILAPYKVSARQYWNRLTDLSDSSIAFPFNLETGNPVTSSNYTYNLLLNQQDRDRPFVDASGYMYANQLTRYADVVCPIDPTKYTVFKFKSPVRQTLQVETLPRPTKYRYPAYNAVAYDLSAQTLFDNSYSFVQYYQNANMDTSPTLVVNTLPGLSNVASTSNFGSSYLSSQQLWQGAAITAQVGDTRALYQFRTPLPVSTITEPAYRYPLSLTLTTPTPSTLFTTPLNMYLYQDRAAFMADISDNRNEKPIHYLTTVSTTTSVSSATLTFPVIANKTYYILARSQDTVIPTQQYQIVSWFPDGQGFSTLTSSLTNFDPLADPRSNLNNFNYVELADPAFIKLPIQPAIQGSPAKDPLFSTLAYATTNIGYDVSGVSNDLTSYCGFFASAPTSNGNPATTLRMDPITGYSFQVESPYSQVSQSYFYTGSENALLKPQGTGLYQPRTVPGRETSIVQWYGTTYIPNSENQPPMLSNETVSSNIIAPYVPSTTRTHLQGYPYGGSNAAIQFGDGVVGVSFTPQQGVWDIQRIAFKSVYTTSNALTDENLKIQYLGIFNTAYTTDRFVHEVDLNDAIAVLSFSKAVRYNTSTLNLGFDPTGGTYYEFTRDSNFRTGSSSYLYGYSQIRQQANFDVNATYSFIPFDANGQFLTFQGLVGSPVPYPYFSDASAGTAYFDGSVPYTQRGIVLPSTSATADPARGPPAGFDQTQVKYEQSMPIGTNCLQYINPYPSVLNPDSVNAWAPLPYAPSLVVADVSGYMLTQDSFYRVFEYGSDVDNYSLTERYQFTLDQIYPPSDPLINFIGVAANEAEYAFFAYSNEPVPTPGTSKLLVRTMRPSDGLVTATAEFANLPTFDPTVQQITNVTYNNFGGFTLALKQGTTLSAICKHTGQTSSMTIVNPTDLAGFNANLDRLITRQSPKESQGRFYVFPYRTLAGPISEGIRDYVKVDPTTSNAAPSPAYTYTAVTGEQNIWGFNYPCEMQVLNLSNATGAQIYHHPIIARQPFKEFVYLMSDTSNDRFYQVTSFTGSNPLVPQFTSNAVTQASAYQYPAAAPNLFQGANAGRWSLIGNILYGNRNDTVDAPRKIFQAWQLFYPVQRIVFRQIAKNFTFLNDLSGLEYPEYPHTALVGYDASANLFDDIDHRWGLESASNFSVADFNFGGFTFNSKLLTFPLQKSTASNPYYYLAVRGYTPTEKSQVLMRFSLNNRYDFGYVSMSDISNEIVLSATASNQFSPDYYASINAFNSNFIIDSNGKIFGGNIVQGYPGSNFSNVTGFSDFYGRFVGLYNQYNTQVQLVQAINNQVKSNTEAFIRSDLQYILPATSLNRQRFTDPLTYTILWRSALFAQYLPLEENWGLGWNLGFAKLDTPYETVHRADSFFKILDDFINLRMNPEFDMNRMDTGAKENLAQTLEPRGATKAFHAKLLLANFGSFAQTMVSNPIAFSPPLGRLDKLLFQWVDVTGAVIDNSDCEWNTVVQVVEKKDVVEIPQMPLINPVARQQVRAPVPIPAPPPTVPAPPPPPPPPPPSAPPPPARVATPVQRVQPRPFAPSRPAAPPRPVAPRPQAAPGTTAAPRPVAAPGTTAAPRPVAAPTTGAQAPPQPTTAPRPATAPPAARALRPTSAGRQGQRR